MDATNAVIDGRRSFEDAVRAALAEAAAAGWRELYWCDVDFANWPIGERAVVESLEQWVGSHRRLTLVALHYDALVKQHPRWVRWRKKLVCRYFGCSFKRGPRACPWGLLLSAWARRPTDVFRFI